jgi:hypothetical protein
MNFTALQARAALLVSLEGWSDAVPAPDWAALVNQAYIQFSWDGECLITNTTVVTVANQAAYTLTGQWRRLMDVVYDSGGANSPVRRSSEEFERYLRADWRVQTGGAPVRYTFAAFNTLALIPPPLAAGVTVAVRGVTEAAPLTSGGDVPSLPDVLHEAIALKAAIFQGKVYAQGEASQRLDRYEAQYREYVQDALRYAKVETAGG